MDLSCLSDSSFYAFFVPRIAILKLAETTPNFVNIIDCKGSNFLEDFAGKTAPINKPKAL